MTLSRATTARLRRAGLLAVVRGLTAAGVPHSVRSTDVGVVVAVWLDGGHVVVAAERPDGETDGIGQPGRLGVVAEYRDGRPRVHARHPDPASAVEHVKNLVDGG